MTAQDYPVTFGYKAQDGKFYGPNGSVGPYHRGNDRPTPFGTPLVIEGVTIGKTGNSGVTSGPHLHTQTIPEADPTPHEFQPGEVVETGQHPQFGNFVKVRVGNLDVVYAHLSEILINKGEVILPMPTGPQVVERGNYIGVKFSEADIDYYEAHPWKVLDDNSINELVRQKSALVTENAQLKEQLSNKPQPQTLAKGFYEVK